MAIDASAGVDAEIVVERIRLERDRGIVLDIERLTIERGTTTALFGPNGSGKTTLLRLISGLEAPGAGTVRVGGLRATTREARQRVAYAFQEPVFVNGTVGGNFDLALGLRGVPVEDRRARISEVAAGCGVDHLLDRHVHRLSRGEAQRANLARALALRAPVTLLDEPLAAMDRATRDQLLDELPELLRRFAMTTVIVTHDRDEAFHVADQLVVLTGGEVRAAGRKGEIYRHPPDRETAELLGYTVLLIDGVLLAVPSGSLTIESGPGDFEARVDGVVDMGSHLRIVATACGGRLHLPILVDSTPPAAGEIIRVRARHGVPIAERARPEVR